MKLIILIIIFNFYNCVVYSQIINNNSANENTKIGYYAAYEKQYSTIVGEYTSYLGLDGGIIINDTYIIGLNFRELNEEPSHLKKSIGFYSVSLPNLQTYYVSILFGYSSYQNKTYNLNSGFKLGNGYASYSNFKIDESGTFAQYQITNNSHYFVFEPYIGVEFKPNIYWIRFEINGSYRFVTGLIIPEYKNNDLNGLGISIKLKLGLF
jgi:hypothetical protein